MPLTLTETQMQAATLVMAINQFVATVEMGNLDALALAEQIFRERLEDKSLPFGERTLLVTAIAHLYGSRRY